MGEKKENNVVRMARQYYPRYWGEKRLAALVRAGKLTTEEYKEITGFVYAGAE